MEILAIAIPVIIIAIYVKGQQNVQNYGDDIMKARDERISQRNNES